MIQVKFKKLSDAAIMPRKATEHAAAFDIYTPSIVEITKGRTIVKTRFAIQMPHNIKANVRARSGFSAKGFEGYIYVLDKNGVLVADDKPTRFDADVTLGLVDSDYTGEVGVIIDSKDDRSFIIPRGARIAQLEFAYVPDIELIETDELEATDRGDGGFGHTGTR